MGKHEDWRKAEWSGAFVNEWADHVAEGVVIALLVMALVWWAVA